MRIEWFYLDMLPFPTAMETRMTTLRSWPQHGKSWSPLAYVAQTSILCMGDPISRQAIRGTDPSWRNGYGHPAKEGPTIVGVFTRATYYQRLIRSTTMT